MIEQHIWYLNFNNLSEIENNYLFPCESHHEKTVHAIYK